MKRSSNWSGYGWRGHRVCAATAAGLLLFAGSRAALAAQDAQPPGGSTAGSSDVLIQYINEQIRTGWQENEVQPSPIADDAEWLRRVYLDLLGHIPPVEVVERFLADKDKTKRSRMIETLLDDPNYVRNWTTIWTNLAIGRQTPRRVSRLGMQKFFREAFARNRPWNEVVYDLIAAEGHYERNGEVNYLLAQMTNNDDAVQATAHATRLFMGIQVQCTQCHDHPFNDWKQDQFWQFNAFFRQARRVDHRRYDPQSGRMVDDYSELVAAEFQGEDGQGQGGVFYERRSGEMRISYPFFFDKRVQLTPGMNLRAELARLMIEGDKPWVARAMVNRMWGHFFGYGFTRPVDDMGPHKAPSHPELLERLTEEFVESRYDVKQLIRWITHSEAYHLTSQFGPGNEIDNPPAGEMPLFSHMYVKQMSAEQLYDSLIVATEAHKSGRSGWEEAEQQRQQWMQQFIIAFGTDENDEATTFNGTIPQALMMMNGSLTASAIDARQGGYLYRVLTEPGTDSDKIQKLWLSTLSRPPTRLEQQGALAIVRGQRTLEDRLAAYQDLFWALLNSNEFILVH